MPTSQETALLDRVPLRLRNEYTAAWAAYESCVLTGGTPEQRQTAYDRASKMEKRLGKALSVAAADQREMLQRHAAHA